VVYEKALVYFDRAIALQPDEPYNYLWKSDALYKLDKKDEAIISLTRAIEIYKEDDIFKLRDAYWMRALSYRMLMKYQEAINDLDKFIMLTPRTMDFHHGYNNRALCYQALARTTNDSTLKSEYLRLADEDITMAKEYEW